MSAFVKIQNLDREIVDLPLITKCNTVGSRLRGLMFRRTLGTDEGLLLVGARDQRLDSAIHMLFVPFDLAVIRINSNLQVADKVVARAWRAAYVPTRPAKYVLELHPIEAGLFMLEVDYTSTTHAWIEPQKSSPFELSLDWTVNLDKAGYFVGRRALEREKREGSLWKLVGLEIDWVGMEKLFANVGLPPQIPGMAVRASLPVLVGNVQVGYASTSTWSPLLKKYIALAHLQKPYYEPDTDVRMEITVEHHRQHAPAKVVKLPFYDPEWKKK